MNRGSWVRGPDGIANAVTEEPTMEALALARAPGWLYIPNSPEPRFKSTITLAERERIV
jgi:hypothetical protein